jgi:hypothetical protein
VKESQENEGIKRNVQTMESNEGEIESWLKTKELEFAQKDNRNPKITPHKYLDKYVFSDLHEVFFCDFPHVLQEWLLRLKDNHPTNRIRQIEWNPVEITQLQQVNNKFTRAVDFWLDSIVAGFITEFAVDTAKSYNATEKEFLRDLEVGISDHCILPSRSYCITKV